MHSCEARAYSTDGCATHGQSDCLCDVQPLEGGVPIRDVPNAERLLQLGVSRLGLILWADELNARQEAQVLRIVAEV